jgi:spermidine synthase
MIAGRMLAPHVGVSLYTWTSIIGVVLAGISAGAYAGGLLADRYPQPRTLGFLLLVSGIMVLFVPAVLNFAVDQRINTALMWRILIITTVIFGLPSFIMGMVSPVVIRLVLETVQEAGWLVGRIYAISTLGSLCGTFLTGFFLISMIGTRHILLFIGIVLILMAVFWGDLFRTRRIAITFLVAPTIVLCGTYDAVFKQKLREDVYFFKESDYFTIKLVNVKNGGETSKKRLHAMVLDNLVHSFVDLDDPCHLEYRYEQLYADVFRWRFPINSQFKSLTIGGGGYTFPRYMEAVYPHAQIDVVELDPEVTRVAHSYLGLPLTTRIRSYNMDGRWYVKNSSTSYDVIFIDVFNDLSVPSHLATYEFALELKRILKPDGIVLANIIDHFQKGLFLPAYLKTLKAAFGEGNVHLLSISPVFEEIRTATFIILVSNGSLDIGQFEDFINRKGKRNAAAFVVPNDVLERYVTNREAPLLTDDYVPIDNLVAPVFEERFGYKKQ